LHHKCTWLTSRNKGNMQLIGDLYFFPYNQIKPQAKSEREMMVNLIDLYLYLNLKNDTL
jgi:hypothetical protein